MDELSKLDSKDLHDVATKLGLLTDNGLTAKEVLRLLEGAQLDEVAIGQ